MSMRLELKGVSKDYFGIKVLREVDFSLAAGEVHALLGENGAGKSTLSKIIAGVAAPSSGTMLLDGKPISFSRPREALNAGIAMVFQETSLVPSLTVAQNLYLGERRFFMMRSRLNLAAQQFMQSLKFNFEVTKKVSQLSAAQRQMVEIARAVHHKANVIIFDEPTATLTPEEKHHFFELVRRLKSTGVAIVFITHALEEALAVSDRITILRDGALVTTGETGQFDRNSVIRAMVGRELSDDIYVRHAGGKERQRGARMLSVQNLSRGRAVRNTSFSIYAGQITGIFGLVGSGRSETARIIAGLDRKDRKQGGRILRGDRAVDYASPREAMKDGVAYITEDRKIEGFFETMSVSDNIFLGRIATSFSSPPFVSSAEKQKLAQTWIKALNVRSASADPRVIELSGGNQQKVVISKSLVQKPEVIIFDEPTRGVDVGSIAEIHKFIIQLAEEGLAVVVISSYLPEVMNLSDRILVSRQGRIVEEFSPEDATEEKIMYAAVH
ncbi:MAG: sugar ABC transporter ATP-binding protein [Rhizobiaceae bacterium]|nr:sugar ABC transporter ATP-binding protein [Rhizobiaceae bacterium]